MVDKNINILRDEKKISQNRGPKIGEPNGRSHWMAQIAVSNYKNNCRCLVN